MLASISRLVVLGGLLAVLFVPPLLQSPYRPPLLPQSEVKSEASRQHRLPVIETLPLPVRKVSSGAVSRASVIRVAQDVGLKIVGEKQFAPFSKIQLKASEISVKKATFKWNIDPKADSLEDKSTIYIWASPGSYRVLLNCAWADDKGEVVIEQAKHSFVVSDDTLPTPKPPAPDPPTPDPPAPDPPKPPAPIAKDGMSVLIVEESKDRRKLPQEQFNILFSKSFYTYLNSVCMPDSQTGSGKAWWILDQNQNVSALAKPWQEAMKRPRKSLPWIIVSNGITGFEGPLPANEEATKKLINKYVPVKKGKPKEASDNEIKLRRSGHGT